MKRKVIIVFSIIYIFVGLIGHEEYLLSSFDPEIIDARAEALGRTSILSSSGANFLFNNSSLLCKLPERSIQISGRAILGETKVEQEFNENNLNYKTNFPIHTKIIGLTFGIPCKSKRNPDMLWGFGIGYRTYYDWGHIEEMNISDIDYECESITSGGLCTLVIGGGFQYDDIYYGGISYSFPLFSNSSNEVEDDYENYKSNGTMKGSFFTFSSSYILHENIMLGTRFRTGYTLKRKGEYNNGDKYNYCHLIPFELGFAVEISPNQKFKLYTEYLTRNFGKYKYQLPNSSTSYSHYLDSKNGFSFRTGFEIITVITLRGGLFIQSVPIYINHLFWSEEYDQYFSKYSKTPEMEVGYTTGLGVQINSQLVLDVYGSFSSVKYNENYEYYGDQFKANYLLKRIKTGCTLGYYF